MPRHNKSMSGNNIEEILRNTLCVLCSNTVSYGQQISVDAVIGITVDSSEVILVNIHEQLDKSGDNSTFGSYSNQQSVKSEPVATGLYQLQEKFTDTAADSSEYTFPDRAAAGSLGFGSSSQPFGDAIDITECDDDGDGCGFDGSCDFEEGQYMDSFQDDQTGEFGDEYYGAGMTHDSGDGDVGDSVYSSDIKPFSMPASQFSGCYLQTHKVVTSFGPRGYKRHTTAKTSIGRGSHAKPVAQHRQPKATVKDEVADYDETGATSSNASHFQGISASEKTTVYTCSVCGKMIRHAGTFQRHKQQHEGIVFRCDLCGAVLSRRDSLNVHRRKCEAKMMQESSSQP